MQCARMLCAAPRCVLNLQNICSALASSSQPGKTSPWLREDICVHLKAASRRFVSLSCPEGSCSSGRRCWRCGSSAQLFFCSSCDTIQPPQDTATYFEILNCDQTFAVDNQKLQGKFIQLQRSLHPDKFSQKSLTQGFVFMYEEDFKNTGEDAGVRVFRGVDFFNLLVQTEQRYSEEQSALVNKAYRTLQKPLTRSVYLLQLLGVQLEEGTDSEADPALLLKIMEVNEKLAETQSLDEVNSVGQEVQVTLKNLSEQMNTALNKGDLQSAREILTQMKYFANLEEKVKAKLRENL